MPDIDQARAAYSEAWATAAEAVTAILAPADKRMNKAMAQARQSRTPVTRPEIASYLNAAVEAREVARAIMAGPEADINEALGKGQAADD